MAADLSGAGDGGPHQGCEFFGPESRGDGKRTIANGEVAPPENPTCPGQKAVGEAVPFDVHDDEAAAGKPVQAADQFDDKFIREVVKERRAQHEIEGLCAERKAESIGRNPRARGLAHVNFLNVERSYGGVPKAPADATSHIPGSGGGIQNREMFAGVDLRIQQPK
jgi:hypothetical protein